jgi:hypothetical protein
MVESLLLGNRPGFGFWHSGGSLLLGYAFITPIPNCPLWPAIYLFPYQGGLFALAIGLIIGVLAAGVPARPACPDGCGQSIAVMNDLRSPGVGCEHKKGLSKKLRDSPFAFSMEP